MASIRKRRNSYCVVYTYQTDDGAKKQKWETFPSYAEAHKRRAEIEYKQTEGTFVAPNKQLISSFMEDFVSLYGEKKWSFSTYSASKGLIKNYVNPLIGSVIVQELTPRDADYYIHRLQKTPPVITSKHQAKPDVLTPANIEKIYKLLKCAFQQAVRWELIARNPFEFTSIPKVEKKARDIWTADTIRLALEHCRDSKLYLAINLAFACSMRVGEILGLTWENTHIEDSNIAEDNAYVYVDRELHRASKESIETLGNKDIIYTFPPVMCNPKSRLVLKSPKTDSSVRRIWLPKTLAYVLRQWRDAQQQQKALLCDEYLDYGLVVAQANGRPCDIKLIENEFDRLKKEAGLPNVVFHSLRHSSTTYKLKLNHGDLKATQGDTGHAQIDMITRVYAHILDEDRKVNAQTFESAFYSNPDLRDVRPPAPAPTIDIQALVAQLAASPELAATLAGLLAQKGR